MSRSPCAKEARKTLLHFIPAQTDRFEWKNDAGSSALFLAQALHSLRGKHNVGKTGVIALTSR